MKKQAKDLKKGNSIKIAGESMKIEEIEISNIGKQGKRKVRMVAKNLKDEKIVLIRPEDYPFETG